MSKTRVAFVVDDSASITQARIEKDIHQAFNRYLNEFSEEAISSGDDIAVSLCGTDWVDDAPGAMTMHEVPIWEVLDYPMGAARAYEEHLKEKHADQDLRSDK